MCEFREKLIPWLDRELPEAEAAAVERHLRLCAECRESVLAYHQVSADFDGLCDATLLATDRPRVPRWALALGAAAAVAAIVLLGFSRGRLERQHPLRAPAVAVRAAAGTAVASQIAPTSAAIEFASETGAPTSARHVRAPRAAPLEQNRAAAQLPGEPDVEVAIPADAMFPPGAVPEGVNFIADFSIAPDGSAQGLRLQPQLASFERRTIQP